MGETWTVARKIAPGWQGLALTPSGTGVNIIAGASLARRTVNLPLSVVQTGCGSRASDAAERPGCVSRRLGMARSRTVTEATVRNRRRNRGGPATLPS